MERSHPRRTWALRLVPLVALALLVPAWARAEEPEEGATPSLPLQRVLLFSSGVGFFEHATEVDGEARLDLVFRAGDINDLLKSMVVQDLGGGRVSTVSYGSRDPIAKALQSFAIDITNNVTMADLFAQVRGEKVSVDRPMPLTGTILGVESRSEKAGDDVLEKRYLNLLTAEGLQSIAFDRITNVRLLDERLDKEMRKALEILSLGRDSQKKTVTLEFLGEGRREVKVGYIRETPVWKTSYRLVLDEEGTPFLQGWAIVENTTEKDWEGVDLSLVSGRPISYEMNLYEPLYAKRPMLQPPVRAGVAPQAYERELQERKKAEKSGGSLRRARGRPGAPPAPARRAEAGFGAPAEDSESFDIGRGVQSAATGGEVGELFQYRIAEPVNLRRQRSAMLPIVNTDVEGPKLSIYDASVHPKHPLNGVMLKNSSDVHLMQGPVTVFDGGAYAGDALLGDLPPGARRLLSYAMDLEVEVAPEGRSRPDTLLSVQIAKGTLVTKHMRRRERTYVAKNSDAKARTLLVAHPFDANWKLVEPAAPEEKTRNQYRFQMKLGAGATEALHVVEEQTTHQRIGLGNLGSDRISFYLRSRTVSSVVKEALAETVRRKAAIDALKAQLRVQQARVKAISEEQARIRANMGQIDHGTDLYARYLKKFSRQEDEIETLRESMQALMNEMAAKTRELNTWLLGLELD